jgi:hypothetical protein
MGQGKQTNAITATQVKLYSDLRVVVCDAHKKLAVRNKMRFFPNKTQKLTYPMRGDADENGELYMVQLLRLTQAAFEVLDIIEQLAGVSYKIRQTKYGKYCTTIRNEMSDAVVLKFESREYLAALGRTISEMMAIAEAFHQL